MVINENIRGKTLADVIDWIDLDWYTIAAKNAIINYVLGPSEKTKGKKKDMNVDWENVLRKLRRLEGGTQNV